MSDQPTAEKEMYRIYRNGQLEYYQATKTDEGFWDDHWASDQPLGDESTWNPFLLDTIFKYNLPGARILEGGCGSCAFLCPMHRYGFRAVGVDFAAKTLQSVKGRQPELNLLICNLSQLPFRDESFDGYWSIGVIEHFRQGFDPLADECYRVLKPGGIAYVSFPYMNLLRKFKGIAGKYETKANVAKGQFYQYALDHRRVRKILESRGLEVIGSRYMFPHARLRSISNRIVRFFLDPWHHHSIMLILRKST